MTEQEEDFMKYLLDNPQEYFCDDVAREFLYDYFEEDKDCIFDEYHCKGCSYYSDCRYNEDCAEAEWELQQQFMNIEANQQKKYINSRHI